MSSDAVDDDPFARKRRKPKAAKRKRRTASQQLAEDSDSDGAQGPRTVRPAADNSRVPVRSALAAGSAKRKPKPFAVPKDLYDVQGADKDDEEDDDARPDYSEAGLQRLRALSSSKRPPAPVPPAPAPQREDSLSQPIVLVEEAPPPPPPPPPPAADAPMSHPAQRPRECGDVLNGDDIDEMEIDTPQSAATGFVSRVRERTELKLGVMNGDDLEAMDLDREETAASGADDWEREQLRRVGIAVGGTMDEDVVDARAIIEEEDLSLAKVVRGEVGLSHVDTFLEAVEEAELGAGEQLASSEKKLAELRTALREDERLASEAAEQLEAAAGRRRFFAELHSFADELAEVMADLDVRVSRMYASRVAKLTAEASANAVRREEGQSDEFGRTVRPLDRVQRLLDDDATDDDEDDGFYDHIFADVDRELKTVPLLTRRFAEWQRLYPREYTDNDGDVQAGNAVGWVVKGSGLAVDDFAWMDQLHGTVRPHAVGSSGVLELTKLALCARWQPYSSKSTKKHAEALRVLLQAASEEVGAQLLDVVLQVVRDEMAMLVRYAGDDVATRGKNRMMHNARRMLDTCATNSGGLVERYRQQLLSDCAESELAHAASEDTKSEALVPSLGAPVAAGGRRLRFGNLGNVYRMQRKLEEALQISSRIHGSDATQPSIADTLHNLGLACQHQGKLEEAEAKKEKVEVAMRREEVEPEKDETNSSQPNHDFHHDDMGPNEENELHQNDPPVNAAVQGETTIWRHRLELDFPLLYDDDHLEELRQRFLHPQTTVEERNEIHLSIAAHVEGRVASSREHETRHETHKFVNSKKQALYKLIRSLFLQLAQLRHPVSLDVQETTLQPFQDVNKDFIVTNGNCTLQLHIRDSDLQRSWKQVHVREQQCVSIEELQNWMIQVHEQAYEVYDERHRGIKTVLAKKREEIKTDVVSPAARKAYDFLRSRSNNWRTRLAGTDRGKVDNAVFCFFVEQLSST